jgi:hypothetical protein
MPTPKLTPNEIIEELAMNMREAKEKSLPKPIFFLGAGASKTGNIPSSKEIIDEILSNFSNYPKIKKAEEKSYPNLMSCLQPFCRNDLLKEYVNNAKLNITHIYLAKLIEEEFVDYVLTWTTS